MKTKLAIGHALATVVAYILAASAGAQTWPERTVRIFCPSPPGGGADIVTRVLVE